MFRQICLATVLLLAPMTYGQDAKTKATDTDTKSPVAKIVGPEKAKVGEQLKYTTDGSVGQDIQFSISPPSASFEPVKLLDGKDTPGVIFTPNKPGTYYIAVMLNSNNKTGHTILVLNVLGSDGGSVPTEYFPLKEAMATDKANDKDYVEFAQKMEEFFGRMNSIANASTTWGQFNKSLLEASSDALDTHMPASRKVIKEYLITKFPKTDGPINKDTIKTAQSEIVATIRANK